MQWIVDVAVAEVVLEEALLRERQGVFMFGMLQIGGCGRCPGEGAQRGRYTLSFGAGLARMLCVVCSRRRDTNPGASRGIELA